MFAFSSKEWLKRGLTFCSSAVHPSDIFMARFYGAVGRGQPNGLRFRFSPIPHIQPLSLNHVNIRRAELKDADTLALFNIQLAAETENLHLDAATVRDGVRALLQDQDKGIYFVAEVGAQIVGQLMITYEWSDWRNGNIWWIQSVYVRPDVRGRGVFSALFKHLRALAEDDQGVCAIRLYMHDQNSRARKSYESLGMTQTHYQVFELDLPRSSGTHQ